MRAHPQAVLLAHAEPRTLPAVLRRMDTADRAELLRGRLSPAVVNAVLDHGSPADREALAANPGLGPEVLARLVDTGEPEVLRRVYLNARAGAHLRRRLVSAPDPVRPRLKKLKSRAMVRPLLHSPHVDLVRHALRRIGVGTGETLIAVDQLHGCANLWRLAGPDAVRRLLQKEAERLHLVAETVQAALDSPDGPALLDKAADEADTTEALLAELRRHIRPDVARSVLATPNKPIDWEAVVREHHREPFTEGASRALVEHPEAPLHILPRLLGTTVEQSLTAPSNKAAVERLQELQLLAPADWLHSVTPAWYTLRVADHMLSRSGGQAGLDHAVRKLAGSLPKDVDGWLRLARTGPGFSGTVPELLAATKDHAPQPVSPASGSPLAMLLSLVPEDLALEVVAALEPAELPALLGSWAQLPDSLACAIAGRLPAELFPALVAALPNNARAATSLGRLDLPEDRRRALDSALVLGYGGSAQVLGQTVFSRYRDGNPLPEPIRRRFIDTPVFYLNGPAHEVAHCHDTEVLAAALRHYTCAAGQLRALLSIWEADGPETVRALLGKADRLPESVEPLLELPDGIDQLRSRAEEAEAEENRFEWPPQGYTPRIPAVLPPGFWPDLIHRHRASPLSFEAVGILLDDDRCPDDFILELMDQSPTLVHHRGSGRNRATVLKALQQTLSTTLFPHWLAFATLRGHVAPAELPDLVRPPEALLLVLDGMSRDNPACAAELTYKIGSLTAHHLQGGEQAWTVARQLLPGFTGTLPELLATASAVSS